MGQWEEAYDDAALDTIEDDAEAINKQLDILDRDRMARENGEKPAVEWSRQDFKDLLHRYPKLRHLRTCELCALFLVFEEQIGSVDYYKRGTMEQMRQCRAHSGPFIESNSDTPAVRQLYKDFTVKTVQVRRDLAADTAKHGTVNEVLITR